MSTPASCTISVLLASESPVGVIVRRGPSRWFQIIRWDTQTDTFVDGQWHNGRFYVDESDLSPDGALLIYMAMNAHWGRTGQVWLTAISRVPYLTSLISWNKGNLSGGGGWFIDNCHACTPDGRIRLPRSDCVLAELDSEERRAASPNRGWKVKRSPDREWDLCRVSGPEPRQNRYHLRHGEDDTSISVDRATWADWDQSGRLVYTAGSVLYALRCERGQWAEQAIADFNDGRLPSATDVPAWAREW